MAQPSSRAELKDYALRRLGHPVLEVNVDDEQVEDLIDDALQLRRQIMDWKKYLEEELKYYDENPEEDNDPIECHSNGSMCLDVDYSTSS